MAKVKCFIGAAALGASLLAAPASAVTVVLDRSYGMSPYDCNFGAFCSGQWFFSSNFTLPEEFKNPTLTITFLEFDDRGAVVLNGRIVDSAGLLGPGLGRLDAPGAYGQDYLYVLGNGARNTVVTEGFQVGVNRLRMYVNDTGGQGIFGNTSQFIDLVSGGTIRATLNYDLTDAVPEPATWVMMIGGFGLIGAAMRRRVTSLNYC